MGRVRAYGVRVEHQFRDAQVFCHMPLDAQKNLHMQTRSGNRAPASVPGPLNPTSIIPHVPANVNT